MNEIEQQKNQSGDPGDNVHTSLTEQERKLIEIIRELKYGEMRILVRDSVPVHVDEIKKSIKL